MNHWMKKIATLALLLCAALSVGLFSACTNGKGPDTPTPPADDAYTVTLTKNFTDAMGTATLTPAAGENGKYAKDTLVTLNVTVNAGYKLTSVKVGSEDVELEQCLCLQGPQQHGSRRLDARDRVLHAHARL